MIRKPYFLSIMVIIALVAPILVIAPRAASQNPDTSGNEAYYNQKGLEYYKEGFYQLAPKRQLKEADQYYELAVAEFKKAISVNANYADAYRNLARVNYVQKKFGEAIEAYKKVTELNPDDLDSYVNLAVAYTQIQKYDEAIEQLEIAKTRTTDAKIIEKLDGYLQKVKQNR
jgi:tetratricopeptide (TPR) repeat protein